MLLFSPWKIQLVQLEVVQLNKWIKHSRLCLCSQQQKDAALKHSRSDQTIPLLQIKFSDATVWRGCKGKAFSKDSLSSWKSSEPPWILLSKALRILGLCSCPNLQTQPFRPGFSLVGHWVLGGLKVQSRGCRWGSTRMKQTPLWRPDVQT